MSSKESNLPFYQIPKILVQDERIKGDHLFIFMILYDYLRTYPSFNKSNKYLSEKTNIGLRQLKIKLNDLEEYGFLRRSGFGSKRQFTLGDKFINRAESEPVLKKYRAESEPILGGKGTSNRAESELHNKNAFKNIIKKKNFSNQLPFNPEYHEYVRRIEADREMGLETGNIEILSLNEWEIAIATP